MLNHKRWSAVLLLSIFSLTLSLPVVAQSITEQGTAQNTRVYLPYVSTTNVSQSSMDTPDALIQLLNQRFANTGIRFFVFDPSGDVVKASSSDGIELPTFKKTDVLQVPSKEALIETVDSVYLGTQDLDAILSLESSYPDTTLQAASLTQRSQTVSWYEAACGANAFYMGGIFCWKNISYSYQIDDVLKKVTAPQVTGSYLSGINYLVWSHDGGSANSINSKSVSLQVRGHYTLAIQYQGITVGSVWSGSWSKTTNPPCAICK